MKPWSRFAAGALALGTLAAAGAALSARPAGTSSAQAPAMVVYKSPSCGCCGKWVEHVKAAGFTVEVHDVADVQPVKRELGVPEGLASCHTALVGKYVIEGHVPADLIKKLVAEKSSNRGLAVPGMVTGSPGMEGPNAKAYDIIAFDQTGKTSTYARR